MAMINKLMDSWQDTYTVRRVFGEPVEKDGVTVIPVAMVAGGGGGGEGTSSEDGAPEEGSGGGFGGIARPSGVFVVNADGVEWHPAFDLTMVAMAGIILGALITLTVGGAIRRLSR